ncbi:hypothetical protein CLV81_1777 [Flagellimonas meridianipacifica]|uniref:Uncharacterized protein n=1 Tax=Flagellimonas meridianipacifica TaxID=1080225 RepID=A0A2T0MJK9_9FLAO|nr:hypothetical protein CLV81_1777 [Allomuricauda pacifica]
MKNQGVSLVFLWNKMNQTGLSEILFQPKQFFQNCFFIINRFEEGLAGWQFLPRVLQNPVNPMIFRVFYF